MKITILGCGFGTALSVLWNKAGHEITAVVTQPDKAKGRSNKLIFSPVKECAVAHNIPVMQPRRIRTPEAIAELKQYEADVYIVAAFGQILTQEILDLPKYGCINIHASLLPAYRGASPIQHVILDEKKETAVNQALENYTENQEKNLTYVSKQTYEKEFKEFTNMFWIVGGALSFVLALIGIFNFINSIVNSLPL